MFDKFELKEIPLSKIQLDLSNPRIVSQTALPSQEAVIEYLFQYEDLASFIKKIAQEGFNPAAERPYVVKQGAKYTVLEGNTRIATYKLLTGLATVPASAKFVLPSIPATMKSTLQNVPCAVAPDRDAVDPIMASAHFGLGDKSRWTYLGSRKAIHDRWIAGKSVTELSAIFAQSETVIRDHLLEYLLYLEALKLSWSDEERNELSSPRVKFNPPVRFLQTSGHREKVGIKLDRTKLKISFDDAKSKKRFKHLILKLVIESNNGLGATSSFEEVFADYGASKKAPSGKAIPATAGSKPPKGKSAHKLKSGALFDYPVARSNGALKQLMSEAASINANKFPGAATFLLRAILECLLKDMIHDAKANPSSKRLSLEDCLAIVKANSAVVPSVEDRKVLKDFETNHLDYVNLGAHGNVTPNYLRLSSARDLVETFIKKHA